MKTRRLLRTFVLCAMMASALPMEQALGTTQPAAAAPSTMGPGARIHPTDLPESAENPSSGSPYASKKQSRTTARQSMSSGPVAGQAHIPVLLVDFSDNPAERDLHSPAEFDAMLFERGHTNGGGSLRDYFLDQSGGTFDVTGTVTPWLRMPRDYSEYVGSRYGYQTGTTNVHTLVQEAVEAADASVDFCNSDADGNGLVDTMFVVHAGPGAEETGKGLWSLQWQLPSPMPTDDVCANGVRMQVKNYTIEPEEYAHAGFTAPGAPDRMVAIGMYVHEFGHVLGLPDLYDTDHSSPGGVGPYDVMAYGAWGYTGYRPWRPAPMSAYSRMRLGWVSPQGVTANLDSVSIPSLDEGYAGQFSGVYKVAPGGSTTASEYFLVENRTRSGWASDFPTDGILIWRVNEARRTTNNSDNANDSSRLLEVVEADGGDTLSAPGAIPRGSAGDFFPGASNVREFGDDTSPSARNGAGEPSGITIANISDPGSQTSASLYISGRPEPVDPPTTDPADPPSAESTGSEEYTPGRVAVRTGRKRGAFRNLVKTDGRSFKIRSTKQRRRYRVDYLVEVYVPKDGNRQPDEMAIGLVGGRRFTSKLRAYNASDHRWIKLGRRAVGRGLKLPLAGAADYVSGDGTVTFRMTFKAKRRFVHALDRVYLELT